MTKGGLETIRSKRSPATGSNRLPARVSIASTPLSSAFSRVNARARCEMSVATIRSTVRRARRAWMPQPVPMSSPRSAGVSSWRPARVSEAPPAPSTCDSGSGPPSAASSRSLAIHHPVVARGIGERLRAHHRERTDGGALPPREPFRETERDEPVGSGTRERRGDEIGRLRHPEHQQSAEHGEGIRAIAQRAISGPPQSACDRIVRDLAPGRAERLGMESGVAQIRGEGGAQGGIRVGGKRCRHQAIQPCRPDAEPGPVNRERRSGVSSGRTVESHRPCGPQSHRSETPS